MYKISKINKTDKIYYFLLHLATFLEFHHSKVKKLAILIERSGLCFG